MEFLQGKKYNVDRVYIIRYGLCMDDVSDVALTFVVEETVFTGVIGHGKGQVMGIGFAHDWIGPFVKLIADFKSRDIWTMYKRQEFSQNLCWCVNAMVLEFINRSRPHAWNLFHFKVK